ELEPRRHAEVERLHVGDQLLHRGFGAGRGRHRDRIQAFPGLHLGVDDDAPLLRDALPGGEREEQQRDHSFLKMTHAPCFTKSSFRWLGTGLSMSLVRRRRSSTALLKAALLLLCCGSRKRSAILPPSSSFTQPHAVTFAVTTVGTTKSTVMRPMSSPT